MHIRPSTRAVARWHSVCRRARSACSQVHDGIRSWDAAEQTADGEGAIAAIETLEGQKLVLRLDSGGVRAEASGDVTPPSTVYDSVSSFLLNNSPGFTKHFNSSLAAALAKVVREREAEEQEEEESRTT